MTPVVCATSMASAFNVVLNLVCIWLLLIVVADLRKVKERKKLRPETYAFQAPACEPQRKEEGDRATRSLPTIGVVITHRRTRSTQPEEGVEITEPEDDGEAVEDDVSHRPQRQGACRADRDHVGVPREKRGAPPIPHYCHFRVAILRGFGVV